MIPEGRLNPDGTVDVPTFDGEWLRTLRMMRLSVYIGLALGDVLGLNAARLAALTPESALLGALPELDSMAIATLFGAIEDRFAVVFDDAELTGDTLADYASLLALVHGKRPA